MPIDDIVRQRSRICTILERNKLPFISTYLKDDSDNITGRHIIVNIVKSSREKVRTLLGEPAESNGQDVYILTSPSGETDKIVISYTNKLFG